MKFFKYLIQVHMQIELQTTVKFKQTKPEYGNKKQTTNTKTENRENSK